MPYFAVFFAAVVERFKHLGIKEIGKQVGKNDARTKAFLEAGKLCLKINGFQVLVGPVGIRLQVFENDLLQLGVESTYRLTNVPAEQRHDRFGKGKGMALFQYV